MATRRRYEKASWFLLFPWSLVSIILILLFNTALSSWFGKNWSWVTLVLIIPAAIFENFIFTSFFFNYGIGSWYFCCRLVL